MAKKSAKTTKSADNLWKKYQHFIIPSLIGGGIAWIFSEDLRLGVIVFITVWIGNWIGLYLRKK